MTLCDLAWVSVHLIYSVHTILPLVYAVVNPDLLLCQLLDFMSMTSHLGPKWWNLFKLGAHICH